MSGATLYRDLSSFRLVRNGFRINVAVNTMAAASTQKADDRDRLIELAHLSAAVGHYLINAFSATVSNSELIRTCQGRASEAKDQASLATSNIETALGAAGVAPS